MKPQRVVKGLAVYRAFAGLSVWLAPSQMGRAFGLEVGDGSAFAYASRLGGIRELALGVGPLLSEGQARRTWLRLALLCDLSDTAAAAAEARGGGFSRGTMARAATATITSGLLTLLALWSESAATVKAKRLDARR
jgi:hypothetical protein